MKYPPIQQQENPILYEPAGAYVPKVGDRVRIRFSGECESPVHPSSDSHALGIKAGHKGQNDANGKTGEVLGECGFRPLHWDVVMDERYTYYEQTYSIVNAAASEMVPLGEQHASDRQAT